MHDERRYRFEAREKEEARRNFVPARRFFDAASRYAKLSRLRHVSWNEYCKTRAVLSRATPVSRFGRSRMFSRAREPPSVSCIRWHRFGISWIRTDGVVIATLSRLQQRKKDNGEGGFFPSLRSDTSRSVLNGFQSRVRARRGRNGLGRVISL